MGLMGGVSDSGWVMMEVEVKSTGGGGIIGVSVTNLLRLVGGVGVRGGVSGCCDKMVGGVGGSYRHLGG